MFDEKRIAGILSAAYERRASILLETDGFEILKALGFKTCQSKFVRSAQEARGADWNSFSGNKVVVKVVSSLRFDSRDERGHGRRGIATAAYPTGNHRAVHSEKFWQQR